jgi:hypothetical protein
MMCHKLKQCCIIIPARIVLVFYCNNLIDLYRHAVISYLCNSRFFVTQAKGLVLTIMYTCLFKL